MAQCRDQQQFANVKSGLGRHPGKRGLEEDRGALDARNRRHRP
jgi:hypothetical protein